MPGCGDCLRTAVRTAASSAPCCKLHMFFAACSVLLCITSVLRRQQKSWPCDELAGLHTALLMPLLTTYRCTACRSSAAEALVDGGAAVDAQDRAGRTALSYAAMYGSTDCIYLLAARGADVAHMDTDGNTPLELAEGSGRQSAVDALKKLQLRVKMQEKRKVKQSKCRLGYSDLDAAQLEAKEQEAARAAAELLEQLEKEEAAKTAKAAKKKKKGKGKAAAADCTASDTTETPQQEAVADMLLPAPANGVHQHQQQHPGSSDGSVATGASWPAQELHGAGSPASPCGSPAFKAADGRHPPRKQAKQAAATSPGGSSTHAGADFSSSSHEQQQQQQHSLAHAATDDTASSVDEAAAAAAVDDELDVLRREWESLLEQAARCRDQRQQPTMLARVAGMLPRCSDAGISVKYGRKVLQRLQAVGPARSALQAALAAQPRACEELDAALTACKSCRCLLEDDLLQLAEDVLAGLLKQQEEQLQLQQQQQQQQQQAAQQLAQQQAQQQQAAQLAERKAQLAVEQAQQPQQRQQREQQQHLLWESNTGSFDAAESCSPVHRQLSPGLIPVRPQPLLQQQQVQQQQVQQSRMQQQQLDRMQQQQQQQQQVQQVMQQMSQPMLAPPLQRPMQQPPPPPPLLQQPQVQQPMPPPQQQQQHMGVQQPPPGATMPFLQQQLRALQQPQLQQHPLGQLQQHQQLLPQQHPLGPPSASSPLSMSNLVASQQQQHQQHPLGQLQLMQHQQLFASPLQGNQMQRGAMQGMLAGTPPPPMSNMLSGPGGMLSNQLLTPISQASVRMQQTQQMQQQQQQLAGSYWGAPQPSLVTPGGFGSVGQPLPRSPVGGGRLSLDMLAPSPRLGGAGGLAAAAGELVRRNSLSTPVAVVAPVLLSGQAEADVLDDHQHPAYAMANALLSDDDDDQPFGCAVVECKLCHKGRADTCCLPCGCLKMCQGCALLWKQRGEMACPWCKAPLEDYAVV
ncbi:hypothetical protein COO60DRAFT_149160 [Scenedesmus sp. NREL 46B-D3]|nr:hypothetical protein COO60DRAFT_149160 [Scenedesmus sp. NREL 46B-D3]